MADSTRCVAIVGAGFSGTVTAINLLRSPHAAALRIVLIDRDRHARGTAYAAHKAPYLLNVPASRMSALSGEPLDFLRFARRTLPEAAAEDFLPRALYGEYLEATLANAELAAAPHLTLERLRGEVRAVDIWRPSHTFILAFADGRELAASEVVLALGNPLPARLPGSDALRESMRLVENPWTGQQAMQPDETVLVVGTGLTMADIVVAAMNTGRGPARIHAISRHGLVPPRQTAFRNAHAEFDPKPLLRAASCSLPRLFRLVRQMSREAVQSGGDWREAVNFVRTLAPRLWAKMPDRERRRFLRHARPYWDIHRHRLPVSTRTTLNELRETQRLIVSAGKILQLEREANQVRVTWRPRGQNEPAVLMVDRVINCTGPDYRCSASPDPLLQHLIANGLVQPDTLGTGLRTAATGGVLNISGRATRGLYYIGPLLRAGHWEATAVQELRTHAENLARQLLLPTARREAAGMEDRVGAASGAD